MDKEIIIALIGAAAIIIAAIIGVWGKKEKTTNIKQKASGKNNTQLGIQINKKESDTSERDS